jgi:HSP20 family protein
VVDRKNPKEGKSTLEGLLGGLTNLLEKVGELAEKAEEISQKAPEQQGGEGKKTSVVYGFSVRPAKKKEEGSSWKVEPFGNVRKDVETGRSVLQEEREPLVDVFEEEEYTLIVAELPGVRRKDIRVAAQGDTVVLSAQAGERKYRKEIRLPSEVREEGISLSYRNGIAEIRCAKVSG